MTILTKNPNGDSNIQLDPLLNNYAQVNDVNDATFVGNNATGTQRDLYTLDGGTVPAGATINKVTAKYRCRYESFLAGGTATASAIVKTHGVEYISGTDALTSAWANYQSDTHIAAWTVNPFTGVAWTAAEITALLAGPNLNTSDINKKEGECAKFYIEVDYTPAAGVTVLRRLLVDVGL